MVKVIAMAVCLFAGCTVLNASAADELLARQLMVATNFQATLKQEFKANAGAMRGADLEKFLSLFNFKKAEDLFVQSVVKSMSNEDVNALLAAYAIPNYASAIRKQSLSAGPIIGFVAEETTRIIPWMGK